MHNSERNEGPLAGIAARWIVTVEDENGALQSISFKNTEHFNFAYDVVDELARLTPQRRAINKFFLWHFLSSASLRMRNSDSIFCKKYNFLPKRTCMKHDYRKTGKNVLQ